MPDPEPRIIVDSDWKKEAEQEKERLAREAEDAGPDGPLPDASFLEIVQMIAMQAAIGLGGMQTPDGRVIPPDMEVARHHIDLLDVLNTKTAGNLDPKEAQILQGILHDLQLSFVNVAKAPGSVAPPDPQA